MTHPRSADRDGKDIGWPSENMNEGPPGPGSGTMRKLYVLRDDAGRILGLSDTPEPGATQAALDDPDIQSFLGSLDLDLVRVLEDVIDLLIARGVFRFTDLPETARHKLMFRKSLRSQWQSVPDPLRSEDDLL
jgi:hypothetical protein